MSVDLSPEERAKIVTERADVKYGPFASLHEAYGVLTEEVDEYYEAESKTTTNGGCDFVTPLDGMRLMLRDDSGTSFANYAYKMRKSARERAEELQRELAEAIDVIAVCDRIIAQWGEKPE